MTKATTTTRILSWIFGLTVMVPGILNLIYIHLVPGIVYLLLSLLLLPPVNRELRKLAGFTIPFAVRFFLFLIICWFTMGISDLGELLGF